MDFDEAKEELRTTYLKRYNEEVKKKKAEEEKKKKTEEVKKDLEENYPIKRSFRLSNMFGVSPLGGESNTSKSWRPTNIAQSLDHISNVFNKGKNSPNGMFDSEQSNDSGYGNFDEEPKNEPSDEKSSSGTNDTSNIGNSKPKSEGTSVNNSNSGNIAPKPTSGRTSPRRNTSRGEYADLENSGKTKAWYESLANSSYANDKAYEADMKAFRKMQTDEIAKNGYYTDSQGVKVYAKAMTDKPKKENNNE